MRSTRFKIAKYSSAAGERRRRRVSPFYRLISLANNPEINCDRSRSMAAHGCGMERAVYHFALSVSRRRRDGVSLRRFSDGKPRGLKSYRRKHAWTIAGKGVRAARYERGSRARRHLNVTTGGEIRRGEVRYFGDTWGERGPRKKTIPWPSSYSYRMPFAMFRIYERRRRR